MDVVFYLTHHFYETVMNLNLMEDDIFFYLPFLMSILYLTLLWWAESQPIERNFIADQLCWLVVTNYIICALPQSWALLLK